MKILFVTQAKSRFCFITYYPIFSCTVEDGDESNNEENKRERVEEKQVRVKMNLFEAIYRSMKAFSFIPLNK